MKLATLLVLAAASAAPSTAPTSSLVGHPAPAFTLPSDRGGNVSLASFHGKQAVVLAFFPKAFTPG